MPRIPKAAVLSTPDRFFQKQLAGEEGVSLPTAKRLYELMKQFASERPWEIIGDQDLILFEDPQSHELCYCSVMGVLGEVISLHVYIGAESYRLFRKVALGKPVSPGEFFASQHAVSAELVRPSDATPPDRELLKAVGCLMRPRVRVPVFRTFRPGYHPWYPTEQEAILLLQCLQAVLVVSKALSEDESLDLWLREDTYPLLTPRSSETGGLYHEYVVKIARLSDPPPAPLAAPHLAEETIRKIQQKDYPQSGTFEADYFVASAAVGGKNERKACTRAALVTDAASGVLFPPALGEPEESAGELLVKAILMAIAQLGRLPQSIHVNKKQLKTCLEPLANRLGFSVRVTKSTPSSNCAKTFFLEQLGERAPFTS
ncbi:MAG: hypothetical protein WA655_19005 [Candidatus Korobacteraceae bacterium]